MFLKQWMFTLGVLASSSVFAWIPNGEVVTIKQVIQWEHNREMVFETSAHVRCYVPNEEKEMYSLILALSISGKSASIHCHDAEEDKGGYPAHKVHRVIMMNN